MMSKTVDVVLNKQYAVDVLRMEVDHNQCNFLRNAAEALAKRLLEDGCIAVHNTYRYDYQCYHTTFTVLTGRQKMRLP